MDTQKWTHAMFAATKRALAKSCGRTDLAAKVIDIKQSIFAHKFSYKKRDIT